MQQEQRGIMIVRNGPNEQNGGTANEEVMRELREL